MVHTPRGRASTSEKFIGDVTLSTAAPPTHDAASRRLIDRRIARTATVLRDRGRAVMWQDICHRTSTRTRSPKILSTNLPAG